MTKANHVFHLSRWWNPAVEDQCNDRIYRIGQSKEVFVHTLIARHPEIADSSFDVILNNLLNRKRGVAKDVLAPMGEISADELSGVFSSTTAGNSTEPVDWLFADRLDPIQFETWVGELFKREGFTVKGTKRTGDHGVDLVIREKSNICALVQCKHKLHISDSMNLSEDYYRSLAASKGIYQAESAQVLVITNGENVSETQRSLGKQYGVRIFAREQANNLPRELKG
jgi:hypothetical protein